MKKQSIFRIVFGLAVVVGIYMIPDIAGAHCDTLDGPVVMTAKAALEKGDITPVLKWVKKEDEKEVRDQFDKTLAVRKQSKEARELADMYFFETLVRIHRAGEGAPYTGLKAVGVVEPSIAAADKALVSGSVDSLVKLVNESVTAGIRQRFEHTMEPRRHADESVEAGRKFVAAYVEFTHYVERLHKDASTHGGHAMEPNKGSTEAHHH